MACLLPETILKNKTESVASSSLSGKVLGLYFSAHWCPPCRGFTPKLVEWLANFKANHASKDQLELVFLSSDRDQAAFDEYYAEMAGFHAVPYENREAKDELSKKFNVRGIPTLVFVDEKGEILSKQGREIVTDDATGAEFPWTPKPLVELLGDSFMDNKGNKFTRADLAGKYVGIYFSAKSCTHRSEFTPKFAATFNKLKEEGKPFEVIFASSDENEESFKEYFAGMPWWALDEDAKSRRGGLSRHFEVYGIPTLVLLDPEFKTITADGCDTVSRDPEGAEFPWYPKGLNPLTSSSFDDKLPVLIAYTDCSEAEVKVAVEALKPAADAEFSKPAPKLAFYYTDDEEEGIVDGLRNYLKLADKDRLVIADLQGNKKFIASNHSFTVENVNEFVQAYLNGSLESAPIRVQAK